MAIERHAIESDVGKQIGAVGMEVQECLRPSLEVATSALAQLFDSSKLDDQRFEPIEVVIIGMTHERDATARAPSAQTVQGG